MINDWTRYFDRWRRCALILVAPALLLAAPRDASAHKSSDAYLVLEAAQSAWRLRWDIALRDLDAALDLDDNHDGQLSWGEVKLALPRVLRYATDRIRLDGCALSVAETGLERRADGTYLAIHLAAACPVDTVPNIHYSLFADIDPTHRGIISIRRAGQAPEVRMLVPDASPPALPAQRGTTPAAPARWEFLREGVRHILGGYDHLLFLLCLLLPSVLAREGGRYRALPRLSMAAWPVLGIVSAFTLAHSITLCLAASKVFTPPPALIEPAIAVTIILAAIDNIRPIFPVRRATVAFVFGLIHGFGFAGALAELNLPAMQYALTLLQFNLGLELGQLFIVSLAILLLFCVRHATVYVPLLLRGGSVAAISVAAFWLTERVGLLPPLF